MPNGYENNLKALTIETLTCLLHDQDSSNKYLEMLNDGEDEYIKNMRKSARELYNSAEKISQIFEFMRNPETLEIISKRLTKNAFDGLMKIYNPERDEHMGARIRQLYKPDEPLVAIVGMGHLYGIKERIRDIHPKTMTLDMEIPKY